MPASTIAKVVLGVTSSTRSSGLGTWNALLSTLLLAVKHSALYVHVMFTLILYLGCGSGHGQHSLISEGISCLVTEHVRLCRSHRGATPSVRVEPKLAVVVKVLQPKGFNQGFSRDVQLKNPQRKQQMQ